MTNTMAVVIAVSRRDGQVTFWPSARTSCRNLNGLTFWILLASTRLPNGNIPPPHGSAFSTQRQRALEFLWLTPAPTRPGGCARGSDTVSLPVGQDTIPAYPRLTSDTSLGREGRLPGVLAASLLVSRRVPPRRPPSFFAQPHTQPHWPPQVFTSPKCSPHVRLQVATLCVVVARAGSSRPSVSKP